MTDSINPVAGAAYVPHTVSASSGTGGGLGTAFSDVLAETLQDQVVQNGIAMSAGGKEQLNSVLGGNSVNTTGNLETMILAAAATGEVNDAQIALFMLMTLMSQETDGEFSALFGMMASMLPNIGGGAEELYSSFTLSDFDDVIKSRVDTEVFGGVYGDIDAIAPLQFWKPANPVVTGDGQNRSPERLRAVIDQFQVETAERYLPGRDGYTYCNIFVWDVTAALGAEIPHYYNKATGEPMYYPDTEGSSAMRAAAMDTWLLDHGEEYGWRKVDAETAQAYANAGKPAVTTAGTIGHAQVVCPSADGGFDPVRGVTIAQAGSKVTGYAYITSIFGASGMAKVNYFVHD